MKETNLAVALAEKDAADIHAANMRIAYETNPTEENRLAHRAALRRFNTACAVIANLN